MGYDLEKYRGKREKVLGVRKRGISIAQLSVLFALVFFAITSVIVLPQAIAYLKNRNLDDVIFRLQEKGEWSRSSLESTRNLVGVEKVTDEGRNKRVVVTFDRHEIRAEQIAQVLGTDGQKIVLLNIVGHGQRMKTLAEEAKFETF